MNEIITARKWIFRNWFLQGLIFAAFLAWFSPGPGAAGGLFKTEITTRLGVILIFFFQGLSLSPDVLRKGIAQWRLHLFVQIFIFIITPLTALVMISPAKSILSADLRLGIFFLSVLPTTIATSVAYTAMAGGNIAGSVFNSTVSNLAGIFITPLWIGIHMQTEGGILPMGTLFLDISLLLLAPLLAGQVLRPFVKRWTDSFKNIFSLLSSLIILFIVYAAFCNYWKQNIQAEQGSVTVLSAAAAAFILFLTVTALVYSGIRLFRFNHENAVSALFCGSQKTLAAGAPMANLIFASQPGLGIILLPLMFYHMIQLFLGGILISRISKKEKLSAMDNIYKV